MNKIKLSEIVKNKKMAIHVPTDEQDWKLCVALNKMGRKWLSGVSYLEHGAGGCGIARQDIVFYPYDNLYGSIKNATALGYSIIPFEDVDFEDEPKVKTLEELGYKETKRKYCIQYSKIFGRANHIISFSQLNNEWVYSGSVISADTTSYLGSLFFNTELHIACANKIKELEKK